MHRILYGIELDFQIPNLRWKWIGSEIEFSCLDVLGISCWNRRVNSIPNPVWMYKPWNLAFSSFTGVKNNNLHQLNIVPWSGLDLHVGPSSATIFHASMWIHVGDGVSLLFWEDAWIRGLTVEAITSEVLRLVRSGLRRSRTVHDGLVGNS
jgi:hypothetical protein